MTRERRDVQISIRIPKRVVKAIDREADDSRRSRADVLNLILDQRYPRTKIRRRARRASAAK